MRIFLLITLVCRCFFAIPQNLIPDPGFEEGKSAQSAFWQQPVGDYNHFYNCTDLEKCRPYKGQGYHALCMYANDVNEFMHVKLNEKMKAGQVYKVSMYVRLSSMSDMLLRNEHTEKIKALHWYFSAYPIDVRFKLHLFVQPSVTFTLRHKEDAAWSLYEAEYTARGDELYLTIGNFTSVYQQLQLEEELNTINDSILYYKVKEDDTVAKIKAEYTFEPMPGYESEIYGFNKNSSVLGGKSKTPRMTKKERKEYNRIAQKNSAMNLEVKRRTEEAARPIKNKIKELEEQYQLLKHAFSVNYCFDEMSVEPVTGKNKNISNDLLSRTFSAGDAIELNNIYFETAKWELLEKSNHELNSIATLLHKHPGMSVTVCGHTDNKGDDVFNNTLSVNRAKAVYDYLISKGIDNSRLSYKGFGSKYPVTDNATEESRARNRRVELLITSP